MRPDGVYKPTNVNQVYSSMPKHLKTVMEKYQKKVGTSSEYETLIVNYNAKQLREEFLYQKQVRSKYSYSKIMFCAYTEVRVNMVIHPYLYYNVKPGTEHKCDSNSFCFLLSFSLSLGFLQFFRQSTQPTSKTTASKLRRTGAPFE